MLAAGSVASVRGSSEETRLRSSPLLQQLSEDSINNLLDLKRENLFLTRWWSGANGPYFVYFNTQPTGLLLEGWKLILHRKVNGSNPEYEFPTVELPPRCKFYVFNPNDEQQSEWIRQEMLEDDQMGHWPEKVDWIQGDVVGLVQHDTTQQVEVSHINTHTE
jgi:hypothetical protein